MQQAIDEILTHHRLADFFQVELERQTSTRQVRGYKGRPARTEKREGYQVHVPRQQEAIEQAKQRLGWRVYAANAPAEQLGLTAVVLAYRGQYVAERSFARLMGLLLAMLPLSVQRDDHAKGVIRMLMIALRASTIVEFVAGRSLVEEEMTLNGLYDGNPKRRTAKPTTESLWGAFDDITLSIRLNQEGEIVEQHMTPLTDLAIRILGLLGMSPDRYDCLTGIPVV